MQPRTTQQYLSVNVWAGILGDFFIEPCLLCIPMDGRAYRIFLQVLQEVFDVPPSLRCSSWYQHDGAPPHYGILVQ
ncbi:hypothetical protein TNCT_696491 [Trichonephila clavata]|uniref:Transposase n=1 Tax=Trichonephila clavata TaxID=2740835 RepID=A0A8X6HY94_TRICU|nr:hypothetical protein TNCT_696491 [Trichonephila clavata]